MQIIKWLGLVAVITLLLACFFPWVYIKGVGTISGFEAPERVGKPAIFHCIFIFFYLISFFIKKVWTTIVAIVAAVLNIGWAFRNFSFTLDFRGDYPVGYPAVYIILISSIVMLLAVLFSGTKEKLSNGTT